MQESFCQFLEQFISWEIRVSMFSRVFRFYLQHPVTSVSMILESALRHVRFPADYETPAVSSRAPTADFHEWNAHVCGKSWQDDSSKLFHVSTSVYFVFSKFIPVKDQNKKDRSDVLFSTFKRCTFKITHHRFIYNNRNIHSSILFQWR